MNDARPIALLNRVWVEMRADDVFGRAAQLAYYFFLAFFPFLICVVASLSVFGVADRGRNLLFGLLARFLPAPAFTLISTTFGQIIQSTGPVKLSFGIVISLWSASMGMSAIMDSLNSAYGVRETRSLPKQYGVAMGLTFAIAVLLVLSVFATLFGDWIVAMSASSGVVAILWRVAEWLLGLMFLLLALAIIFHFAPNRSLPRWRSISPGAVTSIVLLMAVSAGLKLYLHYFQSYDSGYGSLGAVIVLLLFFYLSGIAVLLGGVLNGILGRREARTASRK